MEDRLQSERCAEFLKALASPDRLKIVECLQTGPKNVSQLAKLLAQTLANASHHLRVLHHAGLVEDRKQGKEVIYSLHPTFFRHGKAGQTASALDFGCCRLELADK